MGFPYSILTRQSNLFKISIYYCIPLLHTGWRGFHLRLHIELADKNSNSNSNSNGESPTPFRNHSNHLGRTVPSLIRRNFHGTSQKSYAMEQINEESEITQQIVKDSEKICRLLTTLPKNDRIEAVLDNSGVEISPILVLEVLKRLSNAGVLALEFFRWAEKKNGFVYTTEIYNSLIDSLGKIKQFRMCWVLVDSMRSKGLLTKYTINLIIRRYARAKRVEDGVKAFKKMVDYGMSHDLSDFNRLLDTLSKSRQIEKAHQVFDKMKKRRFVPDQKSYAILLEGWGHERNLLKLDEVYREMKAEGFEPDVVAYGILMNAYCKAQIVDRAVEKFHEMEAKGVEPSPHIYCILINGLGAEQRLGEALKFFEMSKANGGVLEAPTFNSVIGAYCWSAKFDDALLMVDEMRRCGVGPNSRTYDIILHHLVKAGKCDEAYSLFKRMSDDEDCDPTLSTYEIIVRMFCNSGELNMAIQVWEQMKAKGVLPGMHLFAIMINSSRNANKLDIACNFFLEMMDLGIRPPASVFSSLKQAFLDKGKKDTVLVLTKKLDAMRTTSIS